MNIIGIDIGTTNIKAAVYDLSGERVAMASRRMVTHHPRPDYGEYQAEEIWNSVAACLQEIMQQVGDGEVLGIGIASMAEAGVPLDKTGKPTYPIIAWFDPRTVPQADWLAQEVGEDTIYQITGQYHHSKYGLNKLLWIRDNSPESYQATVKWLSMEDYIIYRLSGEFATDYSIASRTLAFDITKRDWSDKILDKAAIPVELMPKVYPGGTMVGKVSRAAAAQSGLKVGIPVVTGGQDHACAAMGVKIFEPGTILDSMGTAESTMIAVAEPCLNQAAYRKRLCMYPHCGTTLYRVITSIQACGGSIEWFMERFGQDLQRQAYSQQRDPYDLLMEEAAKSPFGADGMFFIPHIRGLLGYPSARGAFLGIKDNHGLPDFARAIIEGLAFELQDRVESCEKIFGNTYQRLKVVGGAAKSGFWMQTKADLLGRTVEVPDNDEAASFGAALLAALGTNTFCNEKEAAEHFYRAKAVYYPDPARQQSRDQKYRQYSRTVAVLLEIYETI